MTSISPKAEDAAAKLLSLSACLETRNGFVEVLAALHRGDPATLDEAWGSSCALAAAQLAQHVPGTLVVVLPHVADVENVLDELRLFTPLTPGLFPAWEVAPGEGIIPDEMLGVRLRALQNLAGNNRPKILLTSIAALMQPAPSPASLLANTRSIRQGQRLDIEDLRRWLVRHHFHATSAVELPGEFSVRGGILDIYPIDADGPVRIELFDDLVDSIRQFDVATQRSTGNIEVFRLAVSAHRRRKVQSEDEIDTPVDDAITLDEAKAYADGYLFDHLPPQSWLMLIEPERMRDEGKHYHERLERPEDIHSLPEVLRRAEKFPIVTASGLAMDCAPATCRLGIESVERLSGDVQRVRDELDRAAAGLEVFILCSTQAEAERLGEMFAGTQLAIAGKIHFPLGRLRAGFRLVRENVALVGSAQLFQRTDLKRTARKHLGRPIDTFMDLREGDLVVHLSHGIGRYRGIKLLERDHQQEEHLEIEFADTIKIFVPAAKIDLVQRYIGTGKARPTLAKIGGKAWAKQRKAAEQSVTDLAVEMIELQAMRASRPGIAFGQDTHWQQEFDASFPYQDTPDQALAIEAIKEDMQRGRPMDRLLCGDVGYGKTEMSIRAAFKAIDNGYQVAVLVPTTILAEQHYRSFKERMAEFPFSIGKLSRFCTPQETRETLAGLKAGSVDVVIGTHRVASKDVEFQNLGMVIIDEEQRFGVEVKERLKSLRATVDVLTMTATPIPRTLHMALMGARDISNLQTPPQDRMPVETRVSRWNDELLRHALMRELGRGGQIYFVHNRVEDIERVAKRLQYIVPEAKIRIGHGQMPEDKLEEVMLDFVAGKFDLLLATTIVESGLDIPNANTIFIDEADRYGLSDLHQLRGRVGRYKHRAYCYLLIDPRKHITPNAARRLRAIEEYSQMGAGFSISMRDLEIRGSGNILGTQQSGHITAIGYELYCQMLEVAVRKLKKMPPKLSIDVELDLPSQAYLPDDYVPDMRQKIDLYRRMTRIGSDADLQTMREELRDRFGVLPPPAERMMELIELKIDAATWQIRGARIEDSYLVFNYTDRRRIEQLAKLNRGRLRVVDDKSAYVEIGPQVARSEAILAVAKSVLRAKG